ncbi:MAG: chemotaxis protein CheW, partial [Chromatiaceae bacterium]|nr:chemotaxis protein CheW [Chromatiaceae bacterium]
FLMPHMPQVRAYSTNLDALAERWNLLTLLGQMSNIGMDMTETREGFQNLTRELLHHLGTEHLKKTVAELQAKAQVAVDILIRNLFERTADVGFLATDDDFRDFIAALERAETQEADTAAALAARQAAIKGRFREYVAKYSVYDNIVLLNPAGQVLAQLDEDNPVSLSRDPLIREAIETRRDYVESYRACDLDPRRERSLIYAYRITESNAPKSRVLGVLCLMFRFEDEMAGVFRNLIAADSPEVLTLLDQEGRVIASSDPYHIPLGARLRADPGIAYRIVRFGGREYLAVTRATQGYQGYAGPGWFGHIMVPLSDAFEKALAGDTDQIDRPMLDAVMRRSTLFSEALRLIPRQADKIQKELDVTVWNGNVRIANTKTGDNSFSKTLLAEISKTGARTKEVFEESIGNLNQTVVSSNLADVQFRAALAIDIMDRNLYERANDCRWWALTSYFRKQLGEEGLGEEDRATLMAILGYINNLYTVYTNLFLYDRQGTIVAVSNPEFQSAIGTRLSESWVADTLAIRDSQFYSVSPFVRTWLYADRHTYIYGAAITAIDNPQEVIGGIGIVFDSEPQFAAMLRDALPKTERGEIREGCFAVFADPERRVIASTEAELAPGDVLDLTPDFFALEPGAGLSSIVEYQGSYFVVGARASQGYREYKGAADRYRNALIALVFTKIGTLAEAECALLGAATTEQAQETLEEPPIYPKPSGNEPTTDISTFLIGGRLFGVESSNVICSINNQEITPLVVVRANPGFIGVFSYAGHMVSVISLHDMLGLKPHPYNPEQHGILLVKVKPRDGVPEDNSLLGIVIDRIMDSPEIPNRSIASYSSELAGKPLLTKAIVRPDIGHERAALLSILDVEALDQRFIQACAGSVQAEMRLIGREARKSG